MAGIFQELLYNLIDHNFGPSSQKMINSQFELLSADVKLNPFNPDPEVGRAILKSEEEVGSSFTRSFLLIAVKELRKDIDSLEQILLLFQMFSFVIYPLMTVRSPIESCVKACSPICTHIKIPATDFDAACLD